MNDENSHGRINVLPLKTKKCNDGSQTNKLDTRSPLPEILFITSFPPRECGIATYSQDLIKALKNKFNHSFKISICPLESDSEKHRRACEGSHWPESRYPSPGHRPRCTAGG